MIPARIKFTNKFGFPCDVYGSFIKNSHYFEIYSFEGNYKYRVHRSKIISIKLINLNR